MFLEIEIYADCAHTKTAKNGDKDKNKERNGRKNKIAPIGAGKVAAVYIRLFAAENNKKYKSNDGNREQELISPISPRAQGLVFFGKLVLHGSRLYYGSGVNGLGRNFRHGSLCDNLGYVLCFGNRINRGSFHFDFTAANGAELCVIRY